MHCTKGVQVVNGSVYVAGESPSYESRLLNLKRQLFRLWLDGGLPEGIDVRLEGAAAFSAGYCPSPPPHASRQCACRRRQLCTTPPIIPLGFFVGRSLCWNRRTGLRCGTAATTAPSAGPSSPLQSSQPTPRTPTCCWRLTTRLRVGGLHRVGTLYVGCHSAAVASLQLLSLSLKAAGWPLNPGWQVSPWIPGSGMIRNESRLASESRE